MKIFARIFVLNLSLASVIVVGAQTLLVDNLGKQTTVTKAEIAKLKRVSLAVKDHGKDAAFEGVLLTDVLKLGGVELGEKLRGKNLATYLLVEAADGYRAIYALPELDGDFTDKRVILADKRDGKELAENARYWQLVNETDKRSARWVRQVIKLSVVNSAK